MYGYIYLTTNLINERKYIGQKKSSRFLGTDYLGSGKILRQAIEKYGRENFKVDLLEECFSKEELDQREKDYIREHNAVDSPEYYNIAFGGQSRVHRQSEESKRKMSLSHRRENLSDETLKKMSDSQKKRFSDKRSTFYGRHHTEESKKKLAVAHMKENLSVELRESLSQKASIRNSGRTWINDGVHNKFVTESEIGSYLSRGYTIGRISKFQEGTMWITDGIVNTRVPINSTIPEGWRRGAVQRRNIDEN